MFQGPHRFRSNVYDLQRTSLEVDMSVYGYEHQRPSGYQPISFS